ncbi:hypothetical protein [Streptomyces sp. H34-S4]|uniref:hypothetical protein n=1 Tax=Streptomyces sp. H34-S4 TaxID=2996463 RepID=UPI002271FB85|nr:hypothetical protein [Streptomyces sp. H34-S4]MCY0937414.1 hypothetical protein [Streptomyces sp. H34-S4]
MSTNRPRRIDQSTAEQLLGRGPVASSGDHDALAGLLAAAAAPAAESELAGEQAALAAFRAIRLAPDPVPQHHPRRGPMPTSTLAKLLSAKVAALVVATALGGVAVAAGTGHLPAALGGDPARSEPGSAATSAAPTSGGATSGAAAPSITRRPVTPVPTDLMEPCRAYARAIGANPKGVPAEQRFAFLVAAAGSPENVPRYCAPVVDATAGPGLEPTAPASHTPAGRPSGRPTPGAPGPGKRPTTAGPAQTRTPNGPGDHPTGPPDSRPGPPTTRPKG